MIYFQIANALYYNASLTLTILQKFGVATDVFNLWFQMIQEVKKSGVRIHFRRYIIFILFSFLLIELMDPFSYISLNPYILDSVFWYFSISNNSLNCREHDKKICCLGLTSMLLLPSDQLPDDALQRVFKATLDLLVSYKDQIAGRFLSSSLVFFFFNTSMFFFFHVLQYFKVAGHSFHVPFLSIFEHENICFCFPKV